MQYSKQLRKPYVLSFLGISEGSATHRNIILFDGDPLSGAVVSDDIQSLSKSASSIYSADRRVFRPS